METWGVECYVGNVGCDGDDRDNGNDGNVGGHRLPSLLDNLGEKIEFCSVVPTTDNSDIAVSKPDLAVHDVNVPVIEELVESSFNGGWLEPLSI